jgi:hypothetical protein
VSSLPSANVVARARPSVWILCTGIGAALIGAESCRDVNPPTGADGAESPSISDASGFVPPDCAAQGNDTASPYSALSPEERHREIVHCLRAEKACDDQTCMRILDAAADAREKATLEALVSVRRAARELLHIVTDRDRNRVRESSTDCYRESTQTKSRVGLALGRVEDAKTRLERLPHDPQVMLTIPGRALLRQAELQVRWCTDCEPKHGGQCSEAEDSLRRAQANMDAAGW